MSGLKAVKQPLEIFGPATGQVFHVHSDVEQAIVLVQNQDGTWYGRNLKEDVQFGPFEHFTTAVVAAVNTTPAKKP